MNIKLKYIAALLGQMASQSSGEKAIIIAELANKKEIKDISDKIKEIGDRFSKDTKEKMSELQKEGKEDEIKTYLEEVQKEQGEIGKTMEYEISEESAKLIKEYAIKFIEDVKDNKLQANVDDIILMKELASQE